MLTAFYGFVIAAITLGAFLYSPIQSLIAQGMAVSFDGIKQMLSNPDILTHAQTYAFVALGTSQLFHAIGMRNTDKSVFRMNHLKNKVMIVAFFVGLALQIAVTEIPFLTTMFGTVELSFVEWIDLLLISMVPLVCHEIIVFCKFIARKAKAN